MDLNVLMTADASWFGANPSGTSCASQQRRYLGAGRPARIIHGMRKTNAPTKRALTDPEKRRGKVTDEHREEARKLLAIWHREQPRLKAAGYGSQAAFGEQFEIGNQAAVGFFLNGKTALSPKAAAGFARGLRCRIEDFSPRLAKLLEPSPAELAGTDLMLLIDEPDNAPLILAQAFAQLPKTFPDGGTRGAFLRQLMVWIAARGQGVRPLVSLPGLPSEAIEELADSVQKQLETGRGRS